MKIKEQNRKLTQFEEIFEKYETVVFTNIAVLPPFNFLHEIDYQFKKQLSRYIHMIIHKLLITSVNYPIFRNHFTLSCLLSLRLMRCSHSYKSVEKSDNHFMFIQTVIFKKQGQILHKRKNHLSEYSLLLYIRNSLYSQIFLVIPLSFQIKGDNIQ